MNYPWDHLIDEAADGPYCVYVAWERWMNEQTDLIGDEGGGEVLECCDNSILKTVLFVLMCRACDEIANPTVVIEV